MAELWTIDLASGATEKIASGSLWLPVTRDRGAKLVAAGVTGEGGYLIGYDVIDLLQAAVYGALDPVPTDRARASQGVERRALRPPRDSWPHPHLGLLAPGRLVVISAR